MNKYIILFFLGLSSVSFALKSQNIDQQLSYYQESNGKQQVRIANEIMKIYNNAQLTEELVVFKDNTHIDSLNQQVWYWTAEYYYDQQDFKKAIEYGNKALPLCRDKGIEADCLNLLAMAHFRLSQFREAASYAKQCYILDEKSGDLDVMSSSLNTIAGIYLGANQPREAEKYILKAIQLAKQVDNPARMSVLQGKASEVYHALVNDKKALEHINIACDIEKKLGRDDMLMVRYAQKASVLIGLERYGEAET